MCLVLVGSVTGNAVDLAEQLVDKLRRRDVQVVYKPFGAASLEELQAHVHVFVICSTTGQGELPSATHPLWPQLLQRRLGPSTLEGNIAYSFGLGSSAYPRFNWASRKIHARLLQLGAQPGVPRVESDEIGSEPYEVVFKQWVNIALSSFDEKMQITTLKDGLLPPMYPVTTATEPETHNIRSLVLTTATVEVNKRITAPKHFQDVRLLAIDVPQANWEAGDVLSLYPSNDSRTVDAVFAAQGWDPNRLVHVGGNYTPPGGWTQPLTLYALVFYHLDLNSIPRQHFFSVAQYFCSAKAQQERMSEFSQDLDDLFNYTSRPRRSVAEVFLEFDSLRIPEEFIVDLLPPLRPRQFSIASPAGQTTNKVELAVALVKYKTMLRRIRRGLCSRWIENLPLKTPIYVSLEHNKMRLAERAARASVVVLVATGTGLAPIRALLPLLNQPVLFYGCRNDQDFLFRNELEEQAQVIPCFSRPSEGTKRYVQDAIAASDIAVENAFIFVCGAAGAMPRAVREAFVVSMERRGMHRDVLEAKERDGEYVQETW